MFQSGALRVPDSFCCAVPHCALEDIGYFADFDCQCSVTIETKAIAQVWPVRLTGTWLIGAIGGLRQRLILSEIRRF